MNRSATAVAAVSAAALGMIAAGLSAAQADPQPIAIKPVTGNAAFTDDVRISLHNKVAGQNNDVLNVDDPSGVVVAELRVQPGAMFPWHSHPGPVLVSVVEGELTYVRADDCVPRFYAEDAAFVDPGNRVHTAVNTGDTETVLYATFLDVPEGSPLAIPEAAPEDCEVDRG